MVQSPIMYEAVTLTAVSPDELAGRVSEHLNGLERPWQLLSISHAAHHSPATSIRAGGDLTMFSALVVVARGRES